MASHDGKRGKTRAGSAYLERRVRDPHTAAHERRLASERRERVQPLLQPRHMPIDKPEAQSNNAVVTRILILDDEAALTTMMALLLEREGFEPVVALHGRDALDRLARGDIDLMITDIFMPEMDGLEVLRAAQSLPRPVPIIAVSGGSPRLPQDFLPIARRLGARRTLYKPVRPELLIATVRAVLAEGDAKDDGIADEAAPTEGGGSR